MKSRAFILLGINFCCAGCILPVPHRRAHFVGVEGQVIDSRTEQPVAAARICSLPGRTAMTQTGPDGKFVVKSEYGWHGAYLVGPISYSLLPHFDMPSRIRDFRIEADGYRTGGVAGDRGSDRSSLFGAIRDVGTIRLTPKSAER